MICMGSWCINVSYGVIEDKALSCYLDVKFFFYIFAVTP